jgi:hypothetical protein
MRAGERQDGLFGADFDGEDAAHLSGAGAEELAVVGVDDGV